VVLGSARDVVEECGVSRFLFVDFPLGNPCGIPHDRPMQAAIVEMALGLLESARFPRTTVQAPFRWPDDAWRTRYMAVSDENREGLRLEGERRRALRAVRRSAGLLR
jgi:hypothetical protein